MIYDPTGGRDAEIAEYQRRMELMNYRLDEERETSRPRKAQTNETKAPQHDNERTSTN